MDSGAKIAVFALAFLLLVGSIVAVVYQQGYLTNLGGSTINYYNGTGTEGAQGPQGAAGTDGLDGANGVDGTEGAQGLTGPQGQAANQPLTIDDFLFISYNNETYAAQNRTTGLLDNVSSNASATLQYCINKIYRVGGSIGAFSANYTFNTGIVFPQGSHSINIHGVAGWGKSHVLNNMPIAGTCFIYTGTGDFFSNQYTYNTWDANGLQFSDIIFIGNLGREAVNTTSCFRFTNLDIAVITSCNIFGFGIGFWGEYNGVDAGPMPGMLNFHDNLVSENAVTDIRLNRFMQSKIHDNEFEAWGNFVSHIELIDTNTIQVSDNRFTVQVDRVPTLQQVILILTQSNLYCNQIKISDNIAGMGNGEVKYPFIRMVDTTHSPIYPTVGTESNGNYLQYDYYLTQADTPYIVQDDMTYGDLAANDYILTVNNKGSNLQDLNTVFASGAWYQNTLSPLELNLQITNIGNLDTITVYLGKNSSYTNYAQIQHFINTGVQPTDWSGSFSVPSLYWFKVNVTGTATQAGLYGTYS